MGDFSVNLKIVFINFISNLLPLSEELTNRLFNLIHGYLSPEEMDALYSILEFQTNRYHFHRGCENNFFRIIESSYNKTALLRDFLRYPLQIEVVVAVAANSNYLTDVLVRNPEFIYRIFDPSLLESVLEINFYRELIFNSIGRQKTFEARLHQLKTAKRREILSTGVKDLISFVDLRRATEELSVMATVICEALFLICLEKTLVNYGIDGAGFSELSGKKSVKEEFQPLYDQITDFAVISLGKLGGGELNYSSDIDLIVVFNKNFNLPNGKEYFELLHDTIILFTESAMTMTEAGFLFRVDFRLRPDGHAAPLARTLQDTILYYETRGENWERQMLIKAGFLCGNKKLYKTFIDSVTPFIYPSGFFISPQEQIKKLRNTMLKTIGDEKNIKLFKGGIRDIEFGVQALQLLNGGKNPELRSGNTLYTIGVLREMKILSPDESKTFIEAYIFYRKIEHYLQLMNDRQTHEIPADGDLLKSMTSYLGFESNSDFNDKLNDYRKKVRKIYDSIIGVENSELNEETDFSIFKDQNRAKRNLKFLKEGKGLIEIKEFDARVTSLFMEIEPNLFESLKKRQFPDQTLENLAKIIQRTAFPSFWYEALKDEFILNSVLTLCEFSVFSVNMLLEDHSLKELIFSGKLFEAIEPEIDFNLGTKSILFLAASQFMLGFIDEAKAAQLISRTIRYQVNNLIKNSGMYNEGVFIASAGSFSAGEMNLYSDVDLIVVCDKIELHPELENRFIGLLSDIRKELVPLSVDCRLRPEGKSGQLVWDIDAYASYFEKRIDVWELQSLTKLSFLYGDEKLFDDFTSKYFTKVSSLNREKVREAVSSMRKRLYPTTLSGLSAPVDIIKGRGGVTDIEFINQYLLLLNSGILKFFIGKANREIISAISEAGDLTQSQAEMMLSGFDFLRKIRLAVQCVYQTGNNQLPSKQKGENLYKFLNYESYDELTKAVQSVLKQNNEIFHQILNG